jgi:hypothetical protein
MKESVRFLLRDLMLPHENYLQADFDIGEDTYILRFVYDDFNRGATFYDYMHNGEKVSFFKGEFYVFKVMTIEKARSTWHELVEMGFEEFIGKDVNNR